MQGGENVRTAFKNNIRVWSPAKIGSVKHDFELRDCAMNEPNFRRLKHIFFARLSCWASEATTIWVIKFSIILNMTENERIHYDKTCTSFERVFDCIQSFNSTDHLAENIFYFLLKYEILIEKEAEILYSWGYRDLLIFNWNIRVCYHAIFLFLT